MIETIYIEETVRDHGTTERILADYPKAEVISIGRYNEVFNRTNQNFRLQKIRPSLILAKKKGELVLPTPENYSIGSKKNYYFSHMLNCLYDCRYCFLQGMYRSANYVFFINDEDFKESISQVLNREKATVEEPIYFFSGYDCDSLAMDRLTHFTETYLPFFRNHGEAVLELRTKSVNTRPLLSLDPLENVVVAFTMSPDGLAKAVEHKAPPTQQRIKAALKLAESGWKIGLRLDPIIYHENWEKEYAGLFQKLAKQLPPESIHSVTMGPMRFPKEMFQKIQSLYPRDPLISGPLSLQGKSISYSSDLEEKMHYHCHEILRELFDEQKLFCYRV